MLTVLLVFVYYFFSSIGIAMAKQGKLPAGLGVWAANLIFTGIGVMLLRQAAMGDVSIRGTALVRVFQRPWCGIGAPFCPSVFRSAAARGERDSQAGGLDVGVCATPEQPFSADF